MAEEKTETKKPEVITIPVERAGRKYQFQLEDGALFEDIKTVLSILRDYIVRLQVQDELSKKEEESEEPKEN